MLGNGEAIRKLEAIVHPLVRKAEAEFVRLHEQRGAALIVLDIPLLFEAGGADRVDRIAVVAASPEVQRERVLKRPGMTEQKFEAILTRQMPDAEKRARADFVIDTGQGMEPAREAVAAIIGELTGKPPG